MSTYRCACASACAGDRIKSGTRECILILSHYSSPAPVDDYFIQTGLFGVFVCVIVLFKTDVMPPRQDFSYIPHFAIYIERAMYIGN